MKNSRTAGKENRTKKVKIKTENSKKGGKIYPKTSGLFNCGEPGEPRSGEPENEKKNGKGARRSTTEGERCPINHRSRSGNGEKKKKRGKKPSQRKIQSGATWAKSGPEKKVFEGLWDGGFGGPRKGRKQGSRGKNPNARTKGKTPRAAFWLGNGRTSVV